MPKLNKNKILKKSREDSDPREFVILNNKKINKSYY